MEYTQFLEKLKNTFKTLSDEGKEVSVMINGSTNIEFLEIKDSPENIINIIVIGL